MQIATLAYLPPPNIGHPNSFLANLNAYRNTHPVIFYSNASYQNAFRIDDPSRVIRKADKDKRTAISNYVFIEGIRIAVMNKLDYFFYIEEDSRVFGDEWDGKIFGEFFAKPEALMGGTVAIWNLGLIGHQQCKLGIRWAKKILQETGRPPLIWSKGNFRGDTPGLWVYPNGSCAVYHTATVAQIFAGAWQNLGTYCENMTAWDTVIGRAMWTAHGNSVFEKVVSLPSVYSGYMDFHYNLEDRKRMLTGGEVVAVHQVKSDWIPQ